ncbi:hypothetical protein Poly24_22930 [Rosistilla carotiformis]|uniref:GYF domain-containing protein n=2 Tax=Rosistilla carotiformis TaxID=2528017 RepID=A0A518JSR2_9BACT|nr:hypothetical protein Poly24_22930 [Rosistilla carotiformis]
MGDQAWSMPVDSDLTDSHDSSVPEESPQLAAYRSETLAAAESAAVSTPSHATAPDGPKPSSKVATAQHPAPESVPQADPSAATKSDPPSETAPAELPPDQSQHETSQDESSPLAMPVDVVWYVRPPSGGQYGPAGGALMQQWIQEHRVVPGSLVWRDGWSQWREAEDVFGPNFGTSGIADIDLNADLPEAPLGSQGGIDLGRSTSGVHLEQEPKLTEFERRQLAKRKRRTRMIAMLAAVSLFLIVVIILVIVVKSGDA